MDFPFFEPFLLKIGTDFHTIYVWQAVVLNAYNIAFFAEVFICSKQKKITKFVKCSLVSVSREGGGGLINCYE